MEEGKDVEVITEGLRRAIIMLHDASLGQNMNLINILFYIVLYCITA